MRSVVVRDVFDRELSVYPTLFVGIETPFLVVFLEVSPNHVTRPQIREGITATLTTLQERNPDWQVEPDGENHWHILKSRKPLTDLLTVEHQTAAIQDFVAKGLEDLKVSGTIAAIEDMLRAEQLPGATEESKE